MRQLILFTDANMKRIERVLPKLEGGGDVHHNESSNTDPFSPYPLSSSSLKEKEENDETTLNRDKTTHLLLYSTTGDLYIVSSLAVRNDTQVTGQERSFIAITIIL